MQYGGTIPQQLQDGGTSSGLAYLRRGRKRKEARDKAREAEKTLAEKLGLSRTAGTVLGLGGGLLAAALAPATGGWSLAAPGIGTALGKWAGSKLGYGKDLKVDDMMYGEEQGLYDIQDAADAYKGNMLQDAVLSGAKASLMAGMTPGGGIHGKVAGKLRPDVATGGASLGAAPLPIQPPQLGLETPPPAPDLTSGALVQKQRTLMDSIPSTLKTDSNIVGTGDSVLSEASRISNMPSKSDLDWASSLGRSDELGSMNRAFASSQDKASAELASMGKIPTKTELDYLSSLDEANRLGMMNQELANAQDVELMLSDIGSDVTNLSPNVGEFSNAPEGLEFFGESSSGVPIDELTINGLEGVDMSDDELLNLLMRSRENSPSPGFSGRYPGRRYDLLSELHNVSPYKTDVIANRESGGTVLKNPRTLLGFVG